MGTMLCQETVWGLIDRELLNLSGPALWGPDIQRPPESFCTCTVRTFLCEEIQCGDLMHRDLLSSFVPELLGPDIWGHLEFVSPCSVRTCTEVWNSLTLHCRDLIYRDLLNMVVPALWGPCSVKKYGIGTWYTATSLTYLSQQCEDLPYKDLLKLYRGLLNFFLLRGQACRDHYGDLIYRDVNCGFLHKIKFDFKHSSQTTVYSEATWEPVVAIVVVAMDKLMGLRLGGPAMLNRVTWPQWDLGMGIGKWDWAYLVRVLVHSTEDN